MRFSSRRGHVVGAPIPHHAKARPHAGGVAPRSGLLIALVLFASASAVRADDAGAFGDGSPPFQLLKIESLKDKRVFPGKLFLPNGAGARVPVVIMVPGTDGVDERQDFYRPPLMATGIGTFELDTKTGVFTSEKDRPDSSFFVPVVFSALRTLRAMPAVDPDKIAILGWSFGGGVTMRAAWDRSRRQWLASGERGFAAHIGLYGGCNPNSDLANVPILILVGDKDTYGASRSCDELARNKRQVAVTIYPGAHHGFDKPHVDKRTRGGTMVMKWDEAAALDARRRVVEFLSAAFR